VRRLKKTTKAKLDRLWSKIVRHGYLVCMMCGQPHKMLNAHHMISRRVTAYRWNLNNFVVLCPGCHKWRVDSVHTSPWFVERAIRHTYPDKWKWFVEHRMDLKIEFTKTLDEVLVELKEAEANGN
jgi:hypothetical protein